MKKQPYSLLYVGVSDKAVTATVRGISEIVRMKTTDSIKLAAIHALTQATRSPDHVSISECSFTTPNATPISRKRAPSK